VAFRYRLTYPDGEDGGDLATAVPDWHVGDMFRTGDGVASDRREASNG
jgi:hypothetical protein